MNKKILLTITLLVISLTYTASAQNYSLHAVKSSKEAKQTLGLGAPYLWVGKSGRFDDPISVSGSESLKYGNQKACQYAAIKALAKLKKKARKQNFPIVKNIHSPDTRPGLYYCHIGFRSAKVKLLGTFTHR